MDPLDRVIEGIQQLVAWAKRDPEAAQNLFRLLVGGKENRQLDRKYKTMMIDAGIPAEFLIDSGDRALYQHDPIEPDQELISLSAAAHFSIEATTRLV